MHFFLLFLSLLFCILPCFAADRGRILCKEKKILWTSQNAEAAFMLWPQPFLRGVQTLWMRALIMHAIPPCNWYNLLTRAFTHSHGVPYDRRSVLTNDAPKKKVIRGEIHSDDEAAGNITDNCSNHNLNWITSKCWSLRPTLRSLFSLDFVK